MGYQRTAAQLQRTKAMLTARRTEMSGLHEKLTNVSPFAGHWMSAKSGRIFKVAGSGAFRSLDGDVNASICQRDCKTDASGWWVKPLGKERKKDASHLSFEMVLSGITWQTDCENCFPKVVTWSTKQTTPGVPPEHSVQYSVQWLKITCPQD